MKTHASFLCRFLTAVIPIFIGTGWCAAAPLTWFPGPSLDGARSSGATVLFSGGANLLIGGDSIEVQELFATNNFWTYQMTFYGALLAPGAAAQGGAIIVYGGTDGFASTSATYNYSPTDGTTTLSSMSVPRSYLGYASDHSGNAYAIGGLDDSRQPLASAERFNLDSGNLGAWSSIASLPSARFDFPAVFDGTNQIYVFGGYSDTASGVEIGSVLRYSVSKNSWTNLASLPVPVAGSAAAIARDGKIYVVGGFSGGVPSTFVQVYNPASDSWTLSTPLPEGLAEASAGVDSLDRLIVMGGVDTNGNDVTDVWRSQQLNAPDTAPVFTQFPATNATYLGSYASAIAATGNPQPTYQLISGPAGMAVDSYSGAITWSPQGITEIGSIPVTVQASNFAGATNWDFTITVPNPPPAIPSNLTVVSVTESTVTLSWSPGDPVVGPTTYTVANPHPWHDPKGSGGGINYQILASGIPTNTVTISGLTPNTSYTLDVKATAPGGSTGYAGIGVRTLGVQSPINLQVTGITSTTITLAWTPPPGPVPAASYQIEGWVDFGISTSSAIYGTGITSNSFTVTGLSPGSSHNWAVRAFDAGGNPSQFAFFNNGYLIYNPVPVSPQISTPTPYQLVGAGSPVPGGFQFTASEGGYTLQTVLIQASSNPADSNSWVQIGSLLPTNNPFTFIDTNAALYPIRFYRVVAP